MNRFNKRANKGKALYNWFTDWLRENGISFYESGYENLISHNNADKVIKFNEDKTSKFIRFYPDISLIFEGKSILIDIKNSTGIEKDCFDNYTFLSDTLNTNVLILCKNKKLCKVKDLKFKVADEIDRLSGLKIPVKDFIWITPRELNEFEYSIYLDAYDREGISTSGCTYAKINFENTKYYDVEILKNYCTTVSAGQLTYNYK